MMFAMLVVGVGLVLAGLLAIGFGIPIKEFSTGNTLIIAGVMGVCSGAIMLALWTVVRELKKIARRIGGAAVEARESSVRPVLPAGAMREAAPSGGASLSFNQPLEPPAGNPAPLVPPPPWQDEAVLRDHPMPEPGPSELAPPPPPKPKRNLLFSSTSRKERERAQTRAGEAMPDLSSSDLRINAPVEPAEPLPPSFEDSWPKPERARPPEMPSPRRPLRPAVSETPSHKEDPAVTVLKSGVVDGMAYSLYSDGSIEAELPEGTMRFGSIDELRTHLDQRS
jgi:hypothetical protein